MNATRHLYAIGGILTILTAASFGTAHYKAAPNVSGSVLITNAPNQPVPVKDGRTPITVQAPGIAILLGSGGSGAQPLYTVPAGKRLVIQTIFAEGQSGYGTPIGLGEIRIVNGAAVRNIPLPFESKQESTQQSGENEYVLSNVTLEVDSGSVMTYAIVLQNYNSDAFASVGFSGYLENAS